MKPIQDENIAPPFIPGASNNDSEKTIPLGVGDMAEETAFDPLAGVSEFKKINAGSLVLALVIVMACGGLWFMRSLSKVSAATGSNSEVEATIEKFLKSMKSSPTTSPEKSSSALFSSDASVLAVLSESYTQRQVPLDHVKRNPFIIYGEGPVAVNNGAADDPNLDVNRRKAERQSQFEKAAQRLELKSILMSAQPLANIGGKIVRKGEELVSGDDVTFRVADITKDTVKLVAEDATLGLSMPFAITLRH